MSTPTNVEIVRVTLDAARARGLDGAALETLGCGDGWADVEAGVFKALTGREWSAEGDPDGVADKVATVLSEIHRRWCRDEAAAGRADLASEHPGTLAEPDRDLVELLERERR